MSNSIPLSPKHGLNPTIPVCFWCGNPKNEIALMGRVNPSKKRGKNAEDIKMPMYSLIDYEPCDTCKSYMDQGVTLIAVDTVQTNNLPPIDHKRNLYPTGKFVVIKEDGVKALFATDVAEDMIKNKKCFVDNATVEYIYSLKEKEEEE